jgi:hypothetical protein
VTYATKCCDLKISASSETKLDAELKKHYKGKRHTAAVAEKTERDKETARMYPKGLPEHSTRCAHMFKRTGCPGCSSR